MEVTFNQSEQSAWSRFLVLGTLSGFGIAQPLYDLLGRAPEFLLLHDTSPVGLLAFTAVLSLGLPLVLLTLEQLFGLLGRTWKHRVHLVQLGALSCIFFLLVSKRWLDDYTAIAALTAAVAATVLTIAYSRWTGVGLFLKLLSPTILLFPIVFCAQPEIRQLLRAPRFDPAAVREIEGETPVVFVVFDALPQFSLLDGSGEIDAARYPAFADLAATATWFTNATTVSDHTVKAMPAILTGSRPKHPGLPNYTSYPLNLFTLLGGLYDMNVAEKLTKLCPEALCGWPEESRLERLTSLASDLTVVYLHLLGTEAIRAELPPVETDWMEFRDVQLREGRTRLHRQDRIPIFKDLIHSVDAKAGRSLYFIHSFLPHPPHIHLPSGRRFTHSRTEPSGSRPPWGPWSQDDWVVLHSQQRHILQLQLADNLLGQLLARLRDQGLFDSAIVVVTSDHGASFRPGVSHRQLTEENRADILSIPLLIKRPGQTEPLVDRRPVETIDILPTVAELLGVDIANELEGHSLLDSGWPGRQEKTVSKRREQLKIDSQSLDPGPSLERTMAVFGDGASHGPFPRVEAYPDLLGRSPQSLKVDSRGHEVDIIDQRQLARVDPASGFVPAQIFGTLFLSEPQELPICMAVALNDRIEATTCVYSDADDPMVQWWSVLVPEDRLHPGRNKVEVFVIEDSEDGLSLLPTTLV